MKLIVFVNLVAYLLITVNALPVMRLKLCISSSDPYRLQSQCVICHNAKFAMTARQCTGVPYLPANVTIEEGYCIIRQCRKQLPLFPPQPYFDQVSITNAEHINAVGSGVNTEAVSEYEYYNQHIPVKPVKRRPPAIYTVGRPVRPGLISATYTRGNNKIL